MHGSSSELLLDQQQELLRKRKLLELTGRLENPKPKRKTCKQRLKFYITSCLAMLVSGGFAALLFLVPLYVDPAVSTLMSDFDPESVTCETSQVEYLAGLGNCSWSSCREGCTSDLYKCTHISVIYRPTSNNNETMPQVEATLLVNIKGCGYPPDVLCSDFSNRYAKEGAKFPCHYSRKNSSLVMPTYSRAEHVATIANYFLAPFIVTSLASVALCILHCDCRCGTSAAQRSRRGDEEGGEENGGEKRRKKRGQIEDASEVTISRVETMTPRGDDDEELTVSSSFRPL